MFRGAREPGLPASGCNGKFIRENELCLFVNNIGKSIYIRQYKREAK